MCLITGKENASCAHDWCHMAIKKPQYYALFKSDYIMNHAGVETFKVHKSRLNAEVSYLVPVNPYPLGTKECSDFEFFRQSQTTCAEIAGSWPTDRELFNKSEVKFILIEENISRPVNKCINDGGPWVDTVDLKEVAVYCGPGLID